MADTGKQSTRLQSSRQKDQAFDEIDQKIPEENALEPGRGADQLESVPADVEAGGHRRQDARAAEMFRRPIGEKRRQNGQGNLDLRITDPTPQAQHQPANGQPPGDFSSEDGDEDRGSLAEGEHADADRRHGKAVEHQRGCVICQAFARAASRRAAYVNSGPA